MESTPQSFEDLLATIKKPEKQPETFTIALSDYFEGSESVLTFYKLKAAILFDDTLAQYIEEMKRNRCQERESVQREMAFIIACHKEPVAERPQHLVPGYVNIFDALSEGQKYAFVQEFKEKAGREFFEAVVTKKNSIEESVPAEPTKNGTKSSDSVSVTLSATRPKRRSRSRNSLTSPPMTP